MSGFDSVNRNVSSRVRKVVRDVADVISNGRYSSRPDGQQPKMLGCQQWSGELVAGRGSRCSKVSHEARLNSLKRMQLYVLQVLSRLSAASRLLLLIIWQINENGYLRRFIMLTQGLRNEILC